MKLPSWVKFKQPQTVSEASLRAARILERERNLQEEADKRHAKQDLIIKPE